MALPGTNKMERSCTLLRAYRPFLAERMPMKSLSSNPTSPSSPPKSCAVCGSGAGAPATSWSTTRSKVEPVRTSLTTFSTYRGWFGFILTFGKLGRSTPSSVIDRLKAPASPEVGGLTATSIRLAKAPGSLPSTRSTAAVPVSLPS